MKRHWIVLAAAIILAVSLVLPVAAQYFPNVLVLDGSASSPTITFNNNTNRGFFNDTANSGIGIAVGGSQIGRFVAGGLLMGATGTAVKQIAYYAPSITPAASSAAIQTAEQTFTVTGLATTDFVYVNGPAPTSLCPPVTFRVSAANTLAIGFSTLTAAGCTPAAGTYNIVAMR